jgi:hypothetical protein
MSRAKHALNDVEGAPRVFQIPLFPPLSKGDDRGIFWITLRAWRDKIFWRFESEPNQIVRETNSQTSECKS